MGTFGFAAAVFWIIMLIDCIRNRFLSGRAKVLWIVLLIFLNWVGMLAYFFLACSFSPTARRIRANRTASWQRWQQYVPPARPYQPYQPPYQAPSPAAPYMPPQQPQQAQPPPYRPYEQGYQPQVQPFDREELPPEASIYDSHYEQPQATYPEMPPQQQS
jgi:hypothetical protein